MAQFDSSMKYPAEVGVNAYVRINISLFGKEVGLPELNLQTHNETTMQWRIHTASFSVFLWHVFSLQQNNCPPFFNCTGNRGFTCLAESHLKGLFNARQRDSNRGLREGGKERDTQGGRWGREVGKRKRSQP